VQAKVAEMLGTMTKRRQGVPNHNSFVSGTLLAGLQRRLCAPSMGYTNVYWYRGGAEAWRTYSASSGK